MTRRNFIQRIVYTLLALLFGPDALRLLDVEAVEQLVDELDARPRAAEPRHRQPDSAFRV